MRNKRASLSTFLFVLMVIIVCLTCIFAFAKHKNIVDRQMVGVGSVESSNFQTEVAYTQLKIFSEEAIFYAYNQLLLNYSYNLSLPDGRSYKFFDYSKFKKGNSVSELAYESSFESLIQKRYDFLVSRYPQYTYSDIAIFTALKNARFSVDGENIYVKTILDVSSEKQAGITIAYTRPIDYNFSLNQFDFASLDSISNIFEVCPYSEDNKVRETCLLSLFAGFEFDKTFSGIKSASIGDLDFNVTALVSKKGYFVGPVGPTESEIVYPIFYLVLPSSNGEESKVRALFPNAVFNGIGSSWIIN